MQLFVFESLTPTIQAAGELDPLDANWIKNACVTVGRHICTMYMQGAAKIMINVNLVL